MTDTSTSYYCRDCKKALDAGQRPCPLCGCEFSDIRIQVFEEVKIKESFCLKKFAGDSKKFLVHLKQGWFDSGNKEKHPEGAELTQLVDRENKLYKKKVVDTKTSEIVKDQEQNLSDHKQSNLNA